MNPFVQAAEQPYFLTDPEGTVAIIFHGYVYLDIACEQRTEIWLIRDEVEVAYEYHTKPNGPVPQVSRGIGAYSGEFLAVAAELHLLAVLSFFPAGASRITK